ncbi:MAG: methylated-DNA--[protein]-cysteine S-methyltransferase [Deltaproteobacteria bacterium]|nr:methylated-DNA--[protein]-cysteine S-methyltransferase [Deltaproteobacteria bacterium]
MESAHVIFQVKLGWMGVVGNEKGLQRIYLPGLKREELKKRITSEFPESKENAGSLTREKNQFVEYFSGERIKFDLTLDLSGATPFQKKVYAVMSKIPFGEVRSYRWLAQRIGNPKALRAVGSANARNQWPVVIPCHRIVGSDGRLTGFSAPGGLDLKASLLKLEGIPVAKGEVQAV